MVEKFSPKNFAQIQGMKNEIMKFLGFSKIWDEILKIYFISKIFFFS